MDTRMEAYRTWLPIDCYSMSVVLLYRRVVLVLEDLMYIADG